MQSRNGKQANVAAVFCDTGVVVDFIMTVGNMLLMQGSTMMLYKDKYRKCSMQNHGLTLISRYVLVSSSSDIVVLTRPLAPHPDAQGFNVRAM